MEEHASSDPPLTYEETPVITPIVDEQPSKNTPPTEYPVKKPNRLVSILKGSIFFIILFAIGFALSGFVRTIISTPATTAVPKPTTKPTPKILTEQSKTSTNTAEIVNTPTPLPSEKTYTVLNGLTRDPIEGISFMLPSTVLPLICDGSACGSQGTYLPGGTRFTIAPRGTGQVLADFRGKIISDAGGKPFTIKQTTIGGKPAVEFTTSLVGSTIGGYAFSRMRGYMIEVNDTISLEINHFSPSGITTEFEADDVIFDTIVKSLQFSGNPIKGALSSPPTNGSASNSGITPIQ